MSKHKSPPAPADTEAREMQQDQDDALATRGGLTTAASSALALVREVLAEIPAVEDDPTPRMMAAILAAPDAASWEDLFNASHFKDSAGRQVRVHTFRQNPSQYPGNLNVYFLCDVTFLDTGENDVMTVGSDMAMAQLLNCWKRGDLPHDFEIVRKDRPTKAGFYPMRLRSLKRIVTGDPADVIEGTAKVL
jgi:hypothetical protein